MNKLKFLHIPKNAGSSIEYAAKSKGIKWGKFDKTLKGNKARRWHTPQTIKGYDMFCVVRNPWDRIISQFYHKNSVGSYAPLKLNKWLQRVISALKNKRHTQDNHLLPQNFFVKHSVYVLCFDRIQGDLDMLLEMYSLPPMELGHHYGGGKQNRKRRNATFKRLKRTDLTPSLRKEIKKFYQKDFQIYNLISTLNGPYKVKRS